MKIWVDDIRPAPEGYIWCQCTNHALRLLRNKISEVELIDLDHDMGDTFGGDAIKIPQELERLSYRDADFAEKVKNIKFRFHSANPVGVANMRAIIEKNGWKEIR
ncbi:MAG: hypothetical protein IJA34_00515 [Lachnospiraceae bacterium]|nr:hypothetical protein [Lachnospiraceae bacterium]